MGQIDPKIIEAVVRPEGVTADELRAIRPNYEDHLKALRSHGMHLFTKEIDGQLTYSTVEIDGTVAPAPAQAAAPPAEAPRATQQVPRSEDLHHGTEPDFNARLTVDSFRVKSREGRPPIIDMTPAGPQSAQVATLFSMKKPKGALVMVYLKILDSDQANQSPPQDDESPAVKPEPQHQPPHTASPAGAAVTEKAAGALVDIPPEEGGEDVVEPKDYSSVQINPKGRANEKRPEAKPKEQISREIDEQVKTGELSPDMADSMAKLAGL